MSFFIHKITIFHTNDDETFTRRHFDNVYFRNGFQSGSTGTIVIPTRETLQIKKGDIVYERTKKLTVREVHHMRVCDLNKIPVCELFGSETELNITMDKLKHDKKYRVISVQDNRKGTNKKMHHYKLEVAD